MNYLPHRHGYSCVLIFFFVLINFSISGQNLICPNDIVVPNDIDECGAYVDYDDPDVILPYGNLMLVDGLSSGSLFPVGSTIQTFQASDASGNIVSCSFEVTVIDNSLDSDCDGVGDACDLCDGGDDSVDANGDGWPDCAVWPGFNNIHDDWVCRDHRKWWKKKFYICHDGHGHQGNHNPRTLCVSGVAAILHIVFHGDFLGPCTSCSPRESDEYWEDELGFEQEIVAQQESDEDDQYREPIDESIVVFPNPANNEVRIDLSGFEVGRLNIKIVNILGSVCWEESTDYTLGDNVHQVALNDKFTSGMYLVLVTQNQIVHTQSLLVTRASK